VKKRELKGDEYELMKGDNEEDGSVRARLKKENRTMIVAERGVAYRATMTLPRRRRV